MIVNSVLATRIASSGIRGRFFLVWILISISIAYSYLFYGFVLVLVLEFIHCVLEPFLILVCVLSLCQFYLLLFIVSSKRHTKKKKKKKRGRRTSDEKKEEKKESAFIYKKNKNKRRVKFGIEIIGFYLFWWNCNLPYGLKRLWVVLRP